MMAVQKYKEDDKKKWVIFMFNWAKPLPLQGFADGDTQSTGLGVAHTRMCTVTSFKIRTLEHL